MIKMFKKIKLSGIVAISFSLISKLAYADSTNNTTIKLTDPLGGNESFVSVANNVAGFLLVDIAVPLAVIMVLVGAFQIITAGGDPEKFSKGRKTITYAAVGLACAIIAGGITTLIKNFLGQ